MTLLFEYEFIRGVRSRYGLEWEFNGHIYQDKGFIEVLNILGNDGWQMTVKVADLKYVLMRKSK